MKPSHAFETLLCRALAGGVRALSWERSLAAGATLGDLARALGLRRRVAEENLARAFPERGAGERDAILRAHYRELGRVTVEYSRLAELARAPRGRVVAAVRGEEHLEAVRGRGAILLTGHFGSFELLAAHLGAIHPVDVVVRPLGNPGVEALIARERSSAGLGTISADRGIRRVYQALRSRRWVAMVADQDARRHGVFVPFLGRPASTATGPARIALGSGAPIVMGFVTREPDGRMCLDVEPPLRIADPAARDAVERLTALHAARLEAWVRKRPEMWFWLHRRWKTAPRPEAQPATAAAMERTA
ncbi:MAG TPA: lysophospholipid acyltransferase family protein [Candidatus Eisenbacteria bacterium]